jgi:hypothetical protein
MQCRYIAPKTFLRVRHALYGQPNGRKIPYVQQQRRYGVFTFHYITTRREGSKFLTMT